MSRPDILAIDHAAALAVNRRVYAALARRGLTVALVIPERVLLPSAPAAEPAAADDPPLHRLPFSGRNLRYLAIDGLDGLLAQLRPRVVHINNEPDTPLAWRLGGWARRHGSALTAQSLESEFFPLVRSLARADLKQAARHLRTRFSARLTRRRVEQIFCLSRRAADTWDRLGFAGRTTIMPLGFEPALFHPDAADRERCREALGLTQPTVAYFGRQLEKKGTHLLVAALCGLRELPWQFLIDRRKEESDYTRRLLEPLEAAGLGERIVRFEARHQEMASYMRAADIVAVPSLWEEQYGRVAAEAMAVGACVVASARGALPEIVGEAGVLLPSGDVPALSAALARLLGAPEERRRLGAAAARRAAAALSLECQADIMSGAFRALLAEGRQG
jgi:glycosyltransferase involved in cell wall biosynthesis